MYLIMCILGLMWTCVYEVQQNLKDVCVDSEDLHLLFVCLPHPPGKQGRKVRTAGSEHQAMHPEDLSTNIQSNVTEISAEPHLIHLG